MRQTTAHVAAQPAIHHDQRTAGRSAVAPSTGNSSRLPASHGATAPSPSTNAANVTDRLAATAIAAHGQRVPTSRRCTTPAPATSSESTTSTHVSQAPGGGNSTPHDSTTAAANRPTR